MSLLDQLTDTEFILLVLAVYYVFDCIIWLRPGAVAFRSTLSGGFRPVWEALHWQGHDGGAIWSNLLPFGQTILCAEWPVLVSPVGILVEEEPFHPDEHSDAHAPLFIRWEDVRRITAVGRKILVNDEPFATAGLPGVACWFACRLGEIAQTSCDKQQERIVAFIREATDASATEKRWHEAQRLSVPLAFLAAFLFSEVFVGGPVMIWLCRNMLLRPLWVPAYLLTTILTWLGVTAYYFRAHRSLAPADRRERKIQTLMMMLSPVTAMRAADCLARLSLARFHPLAVAAAVCNAADFQVSARRVLLRLRSPFDRPMTAPEKAENIAKWCRTQLYDACIHIVGHRRLDVGQVLAPPHPDGPDAQSYCPRCDMQFSFAQGRCDACGGVEVLSFSELRPEKTVGLDVVESAIEGASRKAVPVD